MIHSKTKTAKADSGTFLTLLYSFTTITLMFIGILFLQKADAAEVDCSRIINQTDKSNCIQETKPDKPEIKKPDAPQDDTFKPRVPPSTPSAD